MTAFSLRTALRVGAATVAGGRAFSASTRCATRGARRHGGLAGTGIARAALAAAVAVATVVGAPAVALGYDGPTSVTIDGNGGVVTPSAVTGSLTSKLPALTAGARAGYRVAGFSGTHANSGDTVNPVAVPGDSLSLVFLRLGHIDRTIEQKESLNDYTVSELSTISADLSRNGTESSYYEEFSDYLANGATKAFTLNSGAGTMQVRIVGINHDTLAEGKTDYGSTAGLTLMMTHRLPDAHQYKMNNDSTNVGGWPGSLMYKRLGNGENATNEVWRLLPSDLQAAIAPVVKQTQEGNGSTKISTSTDRLWLPSAKEVGLASGSGTAGLAGEGETYAWWAAHNSNDARKELTAPYSDGRAYRAWLRSPVPPSTNCFQFVDVGSLGSDFAHSSLGVVLGFSL